MRAAVVLDLPGHFGPIEASGIWNRVAKWGLDRLYFDIRQIDTHILNVCAAHKVLGGINIDPRAWFNEDLATSAVRVTRKLNDLGFVGTNNRALCPILFDYEEHSIERVVAGLKAWRTTRQSRDTIWSMEPLQGGWVGDRQMRVQITQDTNLKLAPQTYRSEMEPVAQDAVLRDLVRNYPINQIILYYQSFYKDQGLDVHFPVPEGWNGIMYDLEHLTL